MGKELINEETNRMKVKDFFVTEPLLLGRTEIETQDKTNIGRIWSVPASAILPAGQGSTNWQTIARNNQDGNWVDEANSNEGYIIVNLPNGAVVTSCMVLGGVNSPITWELIKKPIAAATPLTVMATANVGNEDLSISSATINNFDFCYFIKLTDIDGTMWGARIIYTL